MRFIILLLIFSFTLTLSAQDDGIMQGEAFVNTVSVNTDAQAADTITIQISGNLADSCTEVDEVLQTIEGNVISLTVTTSRPIDMMCAQVLGDFDITVPIDTSTLSAGTYTLIVNGIQSELTILPPSAAAQSIEATCPTPTADTQLFNNEMLDLCLLYPVGYSVDDLGGGSIAISAPAVGGTGASLLIIMQPRTAPDLATLESNLSAENDTPLTFEMMMIGNRQSIVTADIPSRIPGIDAFVLSDTLQYTFTLQPNDPAFPEATADAEALWSLVRETAIFGAAPADDNTLSEMTCSMPSGDEAAFIGGGVCFVYPAAFDLTESNNVVLVIDGTITLRIQWRPSPGFTLAQVQDSLELTFPNADLTFETVSIGGVEALLTDNIPGVRVSRQLNAIWQDQQYTLTLAPIEGNMAPRAETLWAVVIDSLRFLDFTE